MLTIYFICSKLKVELMKLIAGRKRNDIVNVLAHIGWSVRAKGALALVRPGRGNYLSYYFLVWSQ